MLFLPSKCHNCSGGDIVRSSTYENMYFCKTCYHGGELEPALETPQELLDEAKKVMRVSIVDEKRKKLSPKDLVLIEELIDVYNLTQEEADALDLDLFIFSYLKVLEQEGHGPLTL